MLDESLYVLDDISLNIYSTDVGGDCDYLKLRSDSSMIVNVRAHGGSLDLMSTKVTSWDPATGDVDTDWADGRSYISAISEVLVDSAEVCEGSAKKSMAEARMDVEGSEIAYLGMEASESWGLSWKLRGICNDKSNRDSYEGIGVYGNILDSKVHRLYYGHYSYRHLNGLFKGNAVRDNEIYGFDPHDDSVGLTISYNTVWNNENQGIIFSKYCHDAQVTNNHVYSNYGVGIFAHYVGDFSQIMHNVVEDNGSQNHQVANDHARKRVSIKHVARRATALNHHHFVVTGVLIQIVPIVVFHHIGGYHIVTRTNRETDAVDVVAHSVVVHKAIGGLEKRNPSLFRTRLRTG
ncbi:unnamed protein product [Pylaiella littoralis]